MKLMGQISDMIHISKGCGIFIDYGENQILSDSLWGIKDHKFVKMDKILSHPGTIDLSAYVNFEGLKAVAERH